MPALRSLRMLLCEVAEQHSHTFAAGETAGNAVGLLGGDALRDLAQSLDQCAR